MKKANLFELIRPEIEGKRCVSITSITDAQQNRVQEYSEKSMEVLVPPWLGDEREKEKEKGAARAWLNSMGFGWVCKKGLKPESPNQDSYSMLVCEGEFALLGVYDGHGSFGHFVSDMVRDILPKVFLTHPDRTTDVKKAFEQSFVYCQKMIEQGPPVIGFDAGTSGTTCTMALIVGDSVTIAHVADSRSVIGSAASRNCEDLTIDHKPNLPLERQRIESAKPPGRVVFDGFFNHRVFAAGKMYPGLNMSRAMGDVAAHNEAGLTAFPDVKQFSMTEAKYSGRQQLLLCSDGVWEFVETKDVLALGECRDVPEQCQACMTKIAKISYDRWMADSDNEVADDITGIMVSLQAGHKFGQSWS